MQVTLNETGSGLAVTIPAQLAAGLHLAQGSVVDVSESGGRLIVQPVNGDFPSLDDLIALITDENRHEETDWGPPVGKEIW